MTNKNRSDDGPIYISKAYCGGEISISTYNATYGNNDNLTFEDLGMEEPTKPKNIIITNP